MVWVLELSTLLSIEVIINLLSGKVSCMEVNRKFPLALDLLGKGLPSGVTLNNYSPILPPSVSTNITSTSSFLQYTSSDSTPNSLWKGTRSDNIVVKGYYF